MCFSTWRAATVLGHGMKPCLWRREEVMCQWESSVQVDGLWYVSRAGASWQFGPSSHPIFEVRSYLTHGLFHLVAQSFAG